MKYRIPVWQGLEGPSVGHPVIKAKSQLYLLKPNLFKQAKQARTALGDRGASCSTNGTHRPVPFPSLYIVC